MTAKFDFDLDSLTGVAWDPEQRKQRKPVFAHGGEWGYLCIGGGDAGQKLVQLMVKAFNYNGVCARGILIDTSAGAPMKKASVDKVRLQGHQLILSQTERTILLNLYQKQDVSVTPLIDAIRTRKNINQPGQIFDDIVDKVLSKGDRMPQDAVASLRLAIKLQQNDIITKIKISVKQIFDQCSILNVIVIMCPSGPTSTAVALETLSMIPKALGREHIDTRTIKIGDESIIVKIRRALDFQNHDYYITFLDWTSSTELGQAQVREAEAQGWATRRRLWPSWDKTKNEYIPGFKDVIVEGRPDVWISFLHKHLNPENNPGELDLALTEGIIEPSSADAVTAYCLSLLLTGAPAISGQAVDATQIWNSVFMALTNSSKGLPLSMGSGFILTPPIDNEGIKLADDISNSSNFKLYLSKSLVDKLHTRWLHHKRQTKFIEEAGKFLSSRTFILAWLTTLITLPVCLASLVVLALSKRPSTFTISMIILVISALLTLIFLWFRFESINKIKRATREAILVELDAGEMDYFTGNRDKCNPISKWKIGMKWRPCKLALCNDNIFEAVKGRKPLINHLSDSKDTSIANLWTQCQSYSRSLLSSIAFAIAGFHDRNRIYCLVSCEAQLSTVSNVLILPMPYNFAEEQFATGAMVFAIANKFRWIEAMGGLERSVQQAIQAGQSLQDRDPLPEAAEITEWMENPPVEP